QWSITSLHPFGTLVKELGLIGNIEVETNALLKNCNFTLEESSKNVVKNQVVFTINGSTAQELYDALHILKNEDGSLEIGVHITDFIYFVKPGTALDCKACKRATTVYLVQQAVPMLSPTLSKHLCSLSPSKKIAAKVPEQAILRSHKAPIDRRLEGFAKRAAKMGFEINTSSAGALMKSIKSMEQAGKVPHFVLQFLSTKAIVKAKYFCGSALDIAKWSHYALNIPVYTHFTLEVSPVFILKYQCRG
ncbi:hypothetical protein PTTG_29646, partial [Puccinia triticina 1-1 BBBD Race 1]